MVDSELAINELISIGTDFSDQKKVTASLAIFERVYQMQRTSGVHTEMSYVMESIQRLKSQPTEHSPVPEKDMKSFSDIIGAEREKAEIVREFMRVHTYPNLFVQGKAMLMYGPPGTGKTMIAKGIVSAFNTSPVFEGRQVHLFAASGADMKGKYYGETEKNIKAWFVSAQATAVEHKSISILFLDEFEALAPSRQGKRSSEAGASSLTALLQFIDGVAAFDKVLLLAATNGPWELDSAIMRRFTSKLFVDLPSDETRRKLIEHLILKRVTVPENWRQDRRKLEWWNKYIGDVSDLMGASTDIDRYARLNDFLQKEGRLTRGGVYPLGYSLSDVTHAVNSALNMLSEKLLYVAQTDENGKTCYFELPEVCDRCQKCPPSTSINLTLTLHQLSMSDTPSYFRAAIVRYPSSISISEYDRFIRYYQNPHQFTMDA